MITTKIDDFESIESKKVHLISIITQVYNIDVLTEIEKLLLRTKTDWWTTLSAAEQNAIDEGLADIKAGNVFSHEDVMDEFNKRYKDL